jgi:hypothetical protein
LSRLWLASELARRDQSLLGFYPLCADPLDWSGRSRHLSAKSVDDQNTTWSDWATAWSASLSAWSETTGGTATPFELTQELGRVGFTTRGGTRFAVAQANTDADAGTLLSQGRPVTVSCWFRPEEGFTSGGVLSQAHGVQGAHFLEIRGWEIVWDNGGVNVRLNAGDQDASDLLVPAEEVPQTPWVHLALVLRPYGDLPRLTLYVNGREAAGQLWDFCVGNPPEELPLRVGATPRFTPQGDRYFSSAAGVVGQVRLYARELSPNDVAGLYAREADAFAEEVAPTGAGTPSGQLPLYVSGYGSETGALPLVVLGGTPNAGLPLVTVGALPGATGSLPLFVEGTGDVATAALNLFVSGPVPAEGAGALPLFVFGTTLPGAFGALPLLTSGSYPSARLNLFLRGPDTGSGRRDLNLYVGGAYGSASGDLPLVVAGAVNASCPSYWQTWDDLWEEADGEWGCASFPVARAGSLSLFLQGPPSAVAAAALPLHLRSAVGAGLPLVLYGPPHSGSAVLPLVVLGGVFMSGQLPLFVSGFTGAGAGLPLYTHGF